MSGFAQNHQQNTQQTKKDPKNVYHTEVTLETVQLRLPLRHSYQNISLFQFINEQLKMRMRMLHKSQKIHAKVFHLLVPDCRTNSDIVHDLGGSIYSTLNGMNIL